MSSIELGSRWKFPNGDVLRVEGIILSVVGVSVIVTSEFHGGRDFVKPSFFARASEKLEAKQCP